ncbi:glycosyltransferase [Conexibacter sp. SYSU D00693]|uniref:glycosyltransferase n=1 Tax=Conexibacter sp. SYSU D00693 TaxID=2812560 RepID=UPI00196B3A79|nr:glycosyltransferase [Conexibacter sp. SYSU D00693]
MRIAMVSEHASPLAALGGVDAGGQNVHVAALATAIARRGHEVVVHTRRDDPGLPDRVEMAPGVVVEHVTAGPAAELPKDDLLPHMDAMGDALERRWAADRPDVVHSHFWMSALAALRAAAALGIPVAHTFHALGVVKRRHQGERDTSPAGRIDLERGIARDVDQVVATCSDEVFELVRLGADRRRMTVVPCGVDLERFRPDGPAWERPGDGRLRVVALTRMVERKGTGNVIAALARVPDAELVVAGGPPAHRLREDVEARRLLAIAQEHGVDDRVRLLGRVERPDVPGLLRSADVAVCTPWYEPFGMVAVEAMACGVPVVASAVGGLQDTVVHGATGLHVTPRDPASIAGALAALAADPDRRAAMGQAGARRARARYGWDRVAAATVDAYARLAGAEGREGRILRDQGVRA